MMRILAISDIHGDTERVRKLSYLIEKKDPEVIVIAGDLTRFGPKSAADKVIKELEKHGKRILAISGNGDTVEIEELLDQKKINLANKNVNVDSVDFIGFSGPRAIPIGFNSVVMQYEPVDKRIKYSHFKKKVVVSHIPPLNTKDKVFSGQNVGSEFLRDVINDTQPDLVITGHVHEDKGVYKVGKTVVVNTGALCEGYGAFIDLKNEAEVEFFKV